MAVDKVVSDSANALVIFLLNRDDKVSSQSTVWRIALTDKSQNSARLHSRFHFNLFLNMLSLLSHSVALCCDSAEIEHFCAAVEEFE